MINNSNIINYNTRASNTNSNRTIEPLLFKFMHKSPLTRAYLTVCEIVDSNDIFVERTAQVLRAPPIYVNPLPPNVFSSEFDNTPLPNAFDFYTDGSMTQNPGPGGGAFYSPNFWIQSKLFPILHDSTINCAELLAFKLLFESVYFIYNNYNINKLNLNIYTDSLFCINLFSLSGIPKFDYYYQIMTEIIEIINNINEIANIKIKIIKVKSHIGVEGNEIVDAIAKQAAKLAAIVKMESELDDIDCISYPCVKYNTNSNPIVVDNTLLLQSEQLLYEKHCKLEFYNFCLNPSSNGTRFIGNLSFLNAFEKDLQTNEWIYNNLKNEMNIELKLLTANELSTIIKLRTDHINLNGYQYFMFPASSNHNGLCTQCYHPVIESVQHFLFECKKFEKERKTLYRELRQYNIFFKNKSNFNLKNILFPFRWLPFPDPNDEFYKQKIYERNATNVGILHLVYEFVQKTQRFNGEYGE